MKKSTLSLVIILAAVVCHFAQVVETRLSISPLVEGSKRYHYVPFDVPANAESIEIEYSYDKKGGANTLDIGVFDSDFDEKEKTLSGFRGWSGGRRSKIFLSRNAATNGYTAGRIPQGKWRVIFGLYKVAPEGVEVTIRIRINQIDPTLIEQSMRETNTKYTVPQKEKLPPPQKFNGLNWFRGDLHIHTFHSDGNWTFPMVFDSAVALGLNFVGLTEHNTLSHHPEIDRLTPKYKGLLALRGEEVTTYGGHFNTWGLLSGQVIDFRVTPQNQAELASSLNRVRQSGLIASINHPTALCGGCSWTYGDWSKMDAVEIWNGFWDPTDELALTEWDKLLQTGVRLPVIGSSDTHEPPIPQRKVGQPSLGEPTNHAGMNKLTQKELLTALANGRLWISNLPKNYELEFSAVVGKERFHQGDLINLSTKPIVLNFKSAKFPDNSLVKLISNGKVIRIEETKNGQTQFQMSLNVEKDSYFRVEIRDQENKMLALTNPIYFRSSK